MKQTFGQKLKQAREAADLTREQLAVRAGIHSNTVASLERSTEPEGTVATLTKIATVLGLDLSELLDAKRTS